MSSTYSQIAIIETIIEYFIPYRKLNLISEKLTNDVIISNIDARGYCRMDTVNEKSEQVSIIVIDKDAKCSREKSEFIKYIINPVKNELFVMKNFKELIIIMDDDIINTKKNIIQEVNDLKSLYPQFKINVHPYINFVIPIPFHESVDTHRIMTPDELETLLSIKYMSVANMKTILVSDPPIVWLGGEPGQIVEVTGKSLTAIKTVSYFKIL